MHKKLSSDNGSIPENFPRCEVRIAPQFRNVILERKALLKQDNNGHQVSNGRAVESLLTELAELREKLAADAPPGPVRRLKAARG